MGNNQKQLVSRDTYKRIKNMNREQLSEYVKAVYVKGFESGRKASTPDVLLRTFREVLISVDGIGPTRAEAIMKKLSDVFGVSSGAPQEIIKKEAENDGEETDTGTVSV
jgi:hypothetical protein